MQEMQQMQVESLGQEDLLEEEMATHSSILACRIPWMEEPYSPWGHKELNTTEHTHTHRCYFHINKRLGTFLAVQWLRLFAKPGVRQD